ncbi:MAG TPA: hypothetical protein VFG23_22585 [Polyangia bacterium]|nr:hypothetical protein [Polyangia bacterium]
MSKLITLATLSAGYEARYPSSGVLESVSAAAGKGNGKLAAVEAAAFRPFAAVGGTKVIKATEHFKVAGQVITAGNLVEVSERDAARIIGYGRAVEATPAEIAAAKEDA